MSAGGAGDRDGAGWWEASWQAGEVGLYRGGMRAESRQIGVVAVAFGLLVLCVPASGVAVDGKREICPLLRGEIGRLIESSTCAVASDCAAVFLPEPFGCGVGVSKEAVPLISRLSGQLQARCDRTLYRCNAVVERIDCVAGTCAVELRAAGYPDVGPVDEFGRELRPSFLD